MQIDKSAKLIREKVDEHVRDGERVRETAEAR